MRRSGLFLVLVLAACDARVAPSAPSPVAEATAAVATVVVPTPVSPPVSAPALPVPTPTIPARPFSRTDCDFTTPLGATRCFNPSHQAITLTAALNTPDCGTSFGSHTITITPNQNGYFTLPSPACGRSAQIDVYFGAHQKDCRAPDFSSQRTYAGPDCAPPPPPPPPPPCVDPAWGPWVTVATGAQRCHTERRERTTCSGELQVEFREVCQ